MRLLLEADPSEGNVRKYLDGSLCYVAMEPGAAVGGGVLGPIGEGTLELYNIAVRPGLRGQGIGTALLCHVIEEASVQGFGCLEVGTGTFGFQLAFYQRAGFRAEGEFLARRLGYFGCARDLGKGLLGPFPFYMFNFGYMSLRKR